MSVPPAPTRWKVPAALGGCALAFWILRFGYRYLDTVARHRHDAPLPILLEEGTGVFGGLLLVLVVMWLVRRFPLARGARLRRLPLYLAFMVVGSFAHTWFMATSRAALFPLLGLGAYDYGDMRVRYFMELANDSVMFWMFVGILVGVEAARHAQARKLAEADLRAELARAQVQSLERRLHPHFLFNALNTISAVMYEDPAAADRMIAGLADLLRRALASGEAQEVPLDEELALLDRYLDIMRARFEDQLVVKIEVPDAARRALVPPLLLQPLVENAIHHGKDPRTHRVDAALTARRDGASLLLEVRDHGRGIDDVRPPARGVGLSTTARRLAALYGDDQRLSLQNAEGGGLRVTVALPFREGTAGARPAG